jgi:hypothetical protein
MQTTVRQGTQSKLIVTVFHRFRQTKFVYGGSISSSSQFLLPPQLFKKMKFVLNVVKTESKIISALPHQFFLRECPEKAKTL